MKIKFVDVRKYGFIAEPRYYFFGWAKSPRILGRESAVKALVKARAFLPKGYNFKIWDCKRPRQVQMTMLQSFRRRLRLMHSRLSSGEIKNLVILFGGPVPPPLKIRRLDTHRNGGSFDLIIIDRQGNELYMGTDHDDLTSKAATDYFEKKKRLALLEREAKKNRRLLIKVMTEASFKNYAAEWWHWSYGK